jgi:hypothetical protein
MSNPASKSSTLVASALHPGRHARHRIIAAVVAPPGGAARRHQHQPARVAGDAREAGGEQHAGHARDVGSAAARATATVKGWLVMRAPPSMMR